MEILERIWEIIAGIGNAILGRFERSITGLFGSANARFLRRLQPRVEAIAALEAKYQSMTDAELQGQTADFRRRLAAGCAADRVGSSRPGAEGGPGPWARAGNARPGIRVTPCGALNRGPAPPSPRRAPP